MMKEIERAKEKSFSISFALRVHFSAEKYVLRDSE